MKFLSVCAAVFSLSFFVAAEYTPAAATSGPGCFRVGGIPQSEPLNLRSRPSARSHILAELFVGRHGIIAERGACVPHGVRPSKQWCPVTVYDGGGSLKGWLKNTYLRASDCP